MTAPIAVITGAASGIGLAIAEAANARGYRLALCDVSPHAADLLASKFGAGQYFFRQLDVTDQSAVVKFAHDIQMEFGHVNLLFNNAGIMIPGLLSDQDSSHFDRVISTNLNSIFYMCQAFISIMRGQTFPSRIINVASMAGLVPTPFYGAYSAAKHGVIGLSETLHHELKMQNIDVEVSVVIPSAVATNIMRSRYATELPEDMQNLLHYAHEKTQEIGLSPEDVAHCIFKGIDEERYWIITHPDEMSRIGRRSKRLEKGDAPELEPW